MGSMIRNFINAIQFLTIVTVSKKHRIEEGDLAKSMVYFPVVGFFIGFILVNIESSSRWSSCPFPSGTYSWSRSPF